MIRLIALACGLICGAGFFVTGLHDPALLHSFFTRYQGSLTLGVTLPAIIIVSTLIMSLSRRRGAPLLGGKDEPMPDWTGWKPIACALVFGLGWGSSGYIPITALVSAGTLSPGAPIFLVSALFGMIIADFVSGKRRFKESDRRSVG